MSSCYQIFFLSGFAYYVCVHYYSKPNNAQKLVCVEQKFVLRVFVLTRFYCIVYTVLWCPSPSVQVETVQLYHKDV